MKLERGNWNLWLPMCLMLGLSGAALAQESPVQPAYQGGAGPDAPAGDIVISSDCDAGIVLDDGSFENGLTPVLPGVVQAQRFTIPAYSQLTRVCVALAGIAEGGESLQYEIIVYDATGAGGTEPGAELARVPAAQANGIPDEPDWTFYTTDVAIPVNAGDIFVAVEHISPLGEVFTAYDLDTATDALSYNPNTLEWIEASGGLFIDGSTTAIRIDLQALQTRATFQVDKVFTDGNPGEIEVSISCNTGLLLDQSKTISPGDGVEFVVTDFTDGQLHCTISEDAEAGYTGVYDSTGSASDRADDEDGCHFNAVNAGDANICTITNSPAPVDVIITKEFVIEGNASGVDTGYLLNLHCESEILDGDFGCGFAVSEINVPQTISHWCKTFSGDSAEVFDAQVIPAYPSSECWVEEYLFDSAIEVENGCGNLVVSAGVGDSCTITNTIFFEGIPTLSPASKALMILLLASLGLLAYRRIA